MKTIYIKRNDLFKPLQMLMLNNIVQIDENFIDDNYELFCSECDECNGTGIKDNEPCDECGGEGQYDLEPYQYFLTDLDEWEQERLTSYGVAFGYSDLLEKHIIPIYDFGTSWNAFSYSKEVDDDYALCYDETSERKTVY